MNINLGSKEKVFTADLYSDLFTGVLVLVFVAKS